MIIEIYFKLRFFGFRPEVETTKTRTLLVFNELILTHDF